MGWQKSSTSYLGAEADEETASCWDAGRLCLVAAKAAGYKLPRAYNTGGRWSDYDIGRASQPDSA
eukprot:3547645-Rhodomonas_salina.1